MTVINDLERTRSAALKSILVAGASSVALAVAPSAMAQDAEDPGDQIVVTGSRIQNAGLTSSSPLTTVGQTDLALSNTVNAEQFLNTLPQVVPGFDSSSNNPGVGEATVDLRGLGATRTLVLVNGRRYVSSNQNPGVVDLNTIPSNLIEQVDIVTGGASAIYGSDAMAGVVNFVLRDDFEGVQFDNSYEISEEGDGGIFNTALTLGGNFGDGRGNAVLSVGFTSREDIFQGDRAQSGVTLVDEGTGFAESGSVNIPGTFVLDTGQTIDSTSVLGIDLPCDVEGTVEATDGDDNPLGFCSSDSIGWGFNPNGPGIDVYVDSGPNTDRFNYAPANYLQIPQERYNIYTSGRYEFNEYVEAYAQAIFVSSQTEQLLAPTPVFTTLTINFDNPFLQGDTEALAALALFSTGDTDGDGVQDAQVLTGRRFLETGGRLSDIRNDSFQVQGGLRGKLTDNMNWDVFASFGQANTAISQSGNVDVTAYQAAVRNGTANIFEANGIAPDVAATLQVLGTILGSTEQTVVSGIVDGVIPQASFPTAETPIAFALGVEYREESLETAGAGLGGNIAGFNQAPDTTGRFDVYEVFGELKVPLIEGAAFAEELTFDGAYRYSDYSTVGGVSSYAAGLSWVPTDGFRFRAQFQRAVRAPNIGELFQPLVNGFPNINDPCSGGNNGGFDNLTADQQAAATANCVADGVPAAAVGTNIQPNSQIEGLFGGNEDLREEVADTFTLGVVLEPAIVPGLILTIDYFDIEIEDRITAPTQDLFDLCYLSGDQGACDSIDRTAAGPVDIFNAQNINAAVAATSGIDFTIDYTADLGAYGTFGLYSLITWTDERSLQTAPTAENNDCAGFYGATCGEPIPEINMNTRFDWSLGAYGARLRWSRISAVEDDLFLNGGTPTLFVEGVDAFHQVDLTGFWDATDNLNLSAGIENLFNTDFVVVGDSAAEQSNTFPATYDTIGRTFFVRAVLNF